jgi:hypothetical protein
MTYDSEDRRSVVVEDGGGYNAGLIVGVILVLVVLALIGSFLVGSIPSNNNGGGQPLPSLAAPTAVTS